MANMLRLTDPESYKDIDDYQKAVDKWQNAVGGLGSAVIVGMSSSTFAYAAVKTAEMQGAGNETLLATAGALGAAAVAGACASLGIRKLRELYDMSQSVLATEEVTDL